MLDQFTCIVSLFACLVCFVNLALTMRIAWFLVKFADMFKQSKHLDTMSPKKESSGLIDLNDVGTYDPRFQS